MTTALCKGFKCFTITSQRPDKMTRLQHGLHASGQRLCLSIHFFLALLLETALGAPHEPERFLHSFPEYEVVYPSRVDAKGHFLSYFLSHHAQRVQRREASEDAVDVERVFYRLWHGGHSLHFNLSLNPRLLGQGFVTERRYGGLSGARFHPPAAAQCHFLGEVWEDTTVKGRAAISTCSGLTGMFKLSEEEFFIQPLEKSDDEMSAAQAHAIYKRHAEPPSSPRVTSVSGKQAPNGTCAVEDSHLKLESFEKQRELWEQQQQRRRRHIRRRSVSKEKWVETLVVADPKMVEYHGSKAVESYVLAVMNIVSGLFSDASIGNAINIVVVRLILLEQDEADLKITHHADNSLNSFCKWQKGLNMKGDHHPLHHDVAVLLTRKDICASLNTPCETLGLSHVAGMCQPHRSCSISEDTGLPVAFTVAHELGHNFGIQHDGNGNDCEPVGKRPFVMSPQLLYGTSLPKWSLCSRQYITRFLDRGWGRCLDDPPGSDRLALNSVLPGVLYSAPHQCRLQYGSGSVLCHNMDDVCNTLWCTVGMTCHSKLDGAVDGTSCGEDQWCISGECVAVGHYPENVDGGWASWSDWSACTRTCGSGVQSAQRDCDNPVPKHRGKYCLGERRRYRVCNTTPCARELPSFRDVQCGHFNTLPYKGHFYTWVAVTNKVSPCELHCRPLNKHFSEKMRDAVTDGTPCYEGSQSRDMCINGICKNVGCDFIIGSSAAEDRCGVCNGNSSTCATVKKSFDKSEGLGYVDIGLIPEGAWDICIEEVAAARNYLALRSDSPNKYFLNGGWTIQWNGEYKAAGAVFTYERTGQQENLTSPGPTMEPLWIQLLFQETNPGVRYQYTINQGVPENKDRPASFFYWKYGSWTECSVTCGSGVQRQTVHCVEKTTGIMEEHFCDPLTRPENNQTRCNKEPCPAMWWSGEWQKCSSSCGSSGLTKRTVLCIRAVTVEEQKALQPNVCEHLPKPESVSSCNTHIPCPSDWTTGHWSKCSVTCGSGVRRRNITCSRNTGAYCDHHKKPIGADSCSAQDCPQVADNFDWSGSGWSSKEVLNEINPLPEAKPAPKHSTTKAQPKKPPDVNNVIEGDFHYHNNIENTQLSQDKRVHVDDFYYDYNFINFHEDLSDDFESDGRYSGNEQGFDWPPQEPKPINSVEERTHVETTSAPTASPTTQQSKTNAYTIKTEKQHSTDRRLVKDSDSAATKDPIQKTPEDLDDFLAEDHLLPVFTTHAPPVSTTKRSQTLKDVHTKLFLQDTIKAVPTHDWEHYEDVSPERTGPTLLPENVANTVRGTDISLEPFESPTPETPRHVKESISEVHQSTSQPVFSPDVSLGGVDSEDFNKPPSHFSNDPSNSGNHVDYEHTTSLTGKELLPLGKPTRTTFFHAATTDHAHVITKTSGARVTFSDDLVDFDHNEIVIPSRVTSTSSTATTPRPQQRGFPASATSFLPSLQSPVSTRTNAQWVTGNWSTCSTSCGLGAVWRTLFCSTGSDSDCDPAKRPAPAQRCYLRPCSTWKLGPWSKCSKNCGGGVQSREVLCFDMRDQRPLRPFHCRAMSARPQSQTTCNLQPCLDWYMSSWGQCSEVCGGGEQQRIVTCPEEDQCDRDRQPANIQTCNHQLCAQWLTGSWGQCSASCGGGLQHRLIKCVDTKTEPEEELDQAQCNQELQPASTEKCNLHECKSAPPGAVCLRDRLTSRFCQTLRWLGRCHLHNVRSQCCRTCSLRPQASSDTGSGRSDQQRSSH